MCRRVPDYPDQYAALHSLASLGALMSFISLCFFLFYILPVSFADSGRPDIYYDDEEEYFHAYESANITFLRFVFVREYARYFFEALEIWLWATFIMQHIFAKRYFTSQLVLYFYICTNYTRYLLERNKVDVELLVEVIEATEENFIRTSYAGKLFRKIFGLSERPYEDMEIVDGFWFIYPLHYDITTFYEEDHLYSYSPFLFETVSSITITSIMSLIILGSTQNITQGRWFDNFSIEQHIYYVVHPAFKKAYSLDSILTNRPFSHTYAVSPMILETTRNFGSVLKLYALYYSIFTVFTKLYCLKYLYYIFFFMNQDIVRNNLSLIDGILKTNIRGQYGFDYTSVNPFAKLLSSYLCSGSFYTVSLDLERLVFYEEPFLDHIYSLVFDYELYTLEERSNYMIFLYEWMDFSTPEDFFRTVRVTLDPYIYTAFKEAFILEMYYTVPAVYIQFNRRTISVNLIYR